MMSAPESLTVPVEAPEAMWDGLPRAIMMWLDFERSTPRELFRHLKLSGYEVPDWMREEGELQALDHVPSKGTRCVLIYRAMLENWRAASVHIAGDRAPPLCLGEKRRGWR
jgi:hypothetical protein